MKNPIDWALALNPAARLAAFAGAAIAAIAAALFIAWLLGAPGREAQIRADAQLAAGRAAAAIDSGQAAAAINDAAHAAATDNTAKGQEAAHAIQTAPGADQRLDPALNHTGRRGLCNSPSYARSPACAVQQPRGPQPAR